MTVGELITRLQAFDPSTPVAIDSDFYGGQIIPADLRVEGDVTRENGHDVCVVYLYAADREIASPPAMTVTAASVEGAGTIRFDPVSNAGPLTLRAGEPT